MTINSEYFAFKNGSTTLSGNLFRPALAGRYPAVVVVHAASGPLANDPMYQHLSEHLPQEGIALLLFDRRGSGSSAGDFNTADFADLADDALAGVRKLQADECVDPHRICVWGVSQGGWIAPLAAARAPDEIAMVVAVSSVGVCPAEQMIYSTEYALLKAGYDEKVANQAVDARRVVDAYFRGKETFDKAEQAIAAIENKPWFPLVYLETSNRLSRDVSTDKWSYELDYDPIPPLKQIKLPMLFLYGEVDPWVPIEQSMELIAQATAHHQDVTLERIPKTDHFMQILDGSQHDNSGVGNVSKEYLDTFIPWVKTRFKM